MSITNVLVLCTRCRLLHDFTSPREGSRGCFVGITLSRKLYESLQQVIATTPGGNVSAIVRWCISRFLTEAGTDAFDNLDLFKETDAGVAPVKTCIRIDPGTYKTFERVVQNRGMSPTEAISALLLAYAIGDIPSAAAAPDAASTNSDPNTAAKAAGGAA